MPSPRNDETSIGNLIADRCDLDDHALQEALDYQNCHPYLRIGEVFVRLGYCSEELVEDVMREQRTLRDPYGGREKRDLTLAKMDKVQQRVKELDDALDEVGELYNKIADKLQK